MFFPHFRTFSYYCDCVAAWVPSGSQLFGCSCMHSQSKGRKNGRRKAGNEKHPSLGKQRLMSSFHSETRYILCTFQSLPYCNGEGWDTAQEWGNPDDGRDSRPWLIIASVHLINPHCPIPHSTGEVALSRLPPQSIICSIPVSRKEAINYWPGCFYEHN